ncbi:MAG: hypothetical protein ACI9MR_003016 [Myxococcota bacterium]|jgi:hypothetical protein
MRAVSRLALLVSVAALSVATAACGSNPEEKSGGDAYRNVAQAMPLDEWAAGDLDRGEGDRTDWKSVVLDDTGKVTVSFNKDNKGASATIEFFDERGYTLGSAKQKSGATDPIQLKAKVKRSGRHFVMIRHTGGDATAYSVQVTMGEAASNDGGMMPDL